ncbi:MAG: class I SAM-dependent methyltransferase [Clostridiales bacterium]|jgi:tRNA (adenine22-N1)-methyltransferase|nr:class I SAM-dependent methyltransferase [Clostridiales bacterium]
MKLSKRLQTLADLVAFDTVCDIGTDHGFLPVYLAESGKAKKIAACDISPASLKKAEVAAARARVSSVVETRLGAGLSVVVPFEFETCVIAGIGGRLLCEILSSDMPVSATFRQLLLSPHTDVPFVRKFLFESNFKITNEKLVFEDGKWYNVLVCQPQTEKLGKPTEADLLFGAFRSAGFFDFVSANLQKTLAVIDSIEKNSAAYVPELHNYVRACESVLRERNRNDTFRPDT